MKAFRSPITIDLFEVVRMERKAQQPTMGVVIPKKHMDKFFKRRITLPCTRLTGVRDHGATKVVKPHHIPGEAKKNTTGVATPRKFISFVAASANEKAVEKIVETTIVKPIKPSHPFPDPRDANFSQARQLFSSACPEGLAVGRIGIERSKLHTYVWTVDYVNKGTMFPDPKMFDTSRARSVLQSNTPAGGVLTTLCTCQSKRDLRWQASYKVSSRRSHVRNIIREVLGKVLSCISGQGSTKSSSPELMKDRVKEMVSANGIADDQMSGVELYIRTKNPDNGLVSVVPFHSQDRKCVPQKLFLNTRDVTCAIFGKTRVTWKDIDRLTSGGPLRAQPSKRPFIDAVVNLVRNEVRDEHERRSNVDTPQPFIDGDSMSDRLVHSRLSSATALSKCRSYLIQSPFMKCDQLCELIACKVDERGDGGDCVEHRRLWLHAMDLHRSAASRAKTALLAPEIAVELDSLGLPTGPRAWTAYMRRVAPECSIERILEILKSF